ncbi:phage replisome organizer N-terminal domain-containing protein [Clostridium sp. C2-6-12]|uniref:phage replisome organizer N-terminal domain-containing protein n=1 Tax=Clostridium sp. C2-6-12 TaxID=2698832 RepID=UPI00136D126F|nr:phage replisome organizer N-terminal domain-containing protein [Clostridium sp. C2-6-12]
MSDIKWIKIDSHIFEDEKIKLIETMPEGIMIIYVWIRLLVQAGRINGGGYVYLNENIPYTAEMLAAIFGKPLEAIKSALKILCDLEMIEVASNNVIKIINWEKHQNVEGMEKVRAQNRKRVAEHREKKRQIEQVSKENSSENKDNNFEETKDKKNEEESCGNESIKTQEAESDIISNVTVTEQNKKENKNKNKNKNKKEIKKESEKLEVKETELSLEKIQEENIQTNDHAIPHMNASSCGETANNDDPKAEGVNSKALEILLHYEKITGIPGIINSGSIALALDIHGEKYVKMAINKAIEVNKIDMNYINGILKNWRMQGYPKEDVEVKKNDHGTIGKNGKADKNEFTRIKPKEPRRLTEEERKRVEEKLI